MAKQTIGLPCVGGKSKLAEYICEVIEQECGKSNIKTYISACGGGGKDIFQLHHCLFDTLIYNEYEAGLSDLVHVLTDPANVVLISQGIDKLIEQVMALDVDVTVSEDEDKDEVIKELKLRALFEFALNEQARNDRAAHGDASEKRLDKFTSAIYETILIYGSVQSNRKSIFYKSADGKRDFYEDVYVNKKYVQKLKDVAERAQDIIVKNVDCIELVNEYKDQEGVFIYIDPPYWNCTNDYKNTFDFEKHIELIKACVKSKSKIMISMHEFGVGPYYLGLFPYDSWHVYETPLLPHTTRRNTMNDKLKMLNYYSGIYKFSNAPYFDIPKKGDKIINNTTIREYVFCNFEITDNKEFEKIVSEEVEDIVYMVPENRLYDEGKPISVILETVVYTLFKEKEATYPDSSLNELYEKVLVSLLDAFNFMDFKEIFEAYSEHDDFIKSRDELEGNLLGIKKIIDKREAFDKYFDEFIEEEKNKKKAQEKENKENGIVEEIKVNMVPKRKVSRVKSIYKESYQEILTKIIDLKIF